MYRSDLIAEIVRALPRLGIRAARKHFPINDAPGRDFKLLVCLVCSGKLSLSLVRRVTIPQHTFVNMSDEVKSKGGVIIEVGDTVETPYRGGTHTFEERAVLLFDLF